MTRFLLCFVLCALLSFHVTAQKEDRVLQQKLQSLVSGFQGDVGIYVEHLKTGKMAAINADTIFPTASMIKIPITIGMFQKIERQEINYDTILTYRDSLLYAGEDILGSQLPPYIQVASKSGSVDRSRSEVVLVNAPHGDYVFCVITKNQKDESWTSTNEGYVLLRNISRLLWKHFEPESKWKPADKIEEWY